MKKPFQKICTESQSTPGKNVVLKVCALCASVFFFCSCSKSLPPVELRVDGRFTAELWASEPLLDGPVGLQFDSQGRAFVFESPVYPVESSASLRVKQLEDTNGDGKPDRTLAVTENRTLPPADRTVAPDGTSFSTAALSHIQSGGRTISDHGESAPIFPITENPQYPVLAPADRTCSSTGIAFYSNSGIPGFERALFVAEPVHNLVHCDLIQGTAPALIARRAQDEAEFLASSDPMFRPVNITIGAGNAIYVVDYSAALQSPSRVLEVGVKPDFPLFRTAGKGRIYRIQPKAAPTAPTVPSGSSLPQPAVSAPAGPMASAPLPASVAELESIIVDPTALDTVQAAAVRALGNQPGDKPAAFLISRWRNMTSLPRAEAVEAIFKAPGRIRLFLDQLEKELIPLWCLDDEHRVRLLKDPDRELSTRTRRLLETHDPDGNPVVKKYEAALEKRGTREAGELVYKRLCGRCHTYRGGNNYGPDLWAVSSYPPRRILINILLPSESMVPGREMYMIDLKGGGNVDGIIGSQNETSVFMLHDESRQETILHQDIQHVLLSDASAMPVDLASQITMQDMSDLIRFLTTR